MPSEFERSQEAAARTAELRWKALREWLNREPIVGVDDHIAERESVLEKMIDLEKKYPMGRC